MYAYIRMSRYQPDEMAFSTFWNRNFTYLIRILTYFLFLESFVGVENVEYITRE